MCVCSCMSVSTCVMISFYVCANVCLYVCAANSYIVNVNKSYMREEPHGFCWFLIVMHRYQFSPTDPIPILFIQK